jgi:Fe-S-cluster containining protein
VLPNSIASGDQKLVQIVNAALADSARRSGKWLACKPGCSQCCVGVFAINPLDALRLRKGMAELDRVDPERAERIRGRARTVVERLSPTFPGDPATGMVDQSEEMYDRWNAFANDEPCPALHAENGTCEIYEFRPVICRTFGPPVMDEEENDFVVCELCFDGATDEETAACEMRPDPDKLEAELLKELKESTGAEGETIVAFVLARA